MKMATVMGSPDTNKQKEITDILHKLNQPLTAINNYAQAGRTLLTAGHPDPERLRELFDKIADQSARSFEISRELNKLDLDGTPSATGN